MTLEARQDLRDTLLYTRSRWDRRQVGISKAKLDRAMRELTRFPYRGEAHDDVSAGLRGLLVEAHIIYYRLSDQTVSVVRMLHQAMDASLRIRP